MRLPSFVTAETVADLLGWVPRIRRLVSQAARDRGILGWTASPADDSFYDCVIRLLEAPHGGWRLNELILAADPDKQRTLTKAIGRAVARDLDRPSFSGRSAQSIKRLLRADCSQSAAWVTFDILSCSDRSVPHDSVLHEITELVEAEDELRGALGNYWMDWFCLGKESCQASLTPACDVEKAWVHTVAALRVQLDSAQLFDDGLLQVVRDSAEALQGIMDRRAKSDAQASELAKKRSETLDLMRTLAGGLPPGLDWALRLQTAIDRGGWDRAGGDELTRDAKWLEATRDVLEAAEAELVQAKGRDNADDNAISWSALALARGNRDEGRARCQAEVEAMLARLHLDDEGDEGFANKIASETFPPIEHSVVATLATEAEPLANGRSLPAIVFSTAASSSHLDVPALYAADQNGETPCLTAPPTEVGGNGLTPLPPEGPDDDDKTVPVIDPALPIADSVAALALLEGRYGLAAYIAQAAETLGGRAVAGAGSAVLRALCLGEAMDEYRFASVETQYGKLLPSILDEIDGAAAPSKPLALLVLAGALRPALFSFHTGASEALRKAELGKLGPGMHRLADFIITELPGRGGTLDLAMIGPVVNQPALKIELAQTRQHILAMADAAHSRKAVFARASFIWRELFKKGPIYGAVDALRTNAPGAATEIDEVAAWLTQDIPARAVELDQQARKRREEALEGRALEWLLASLSDLGNRLQSWLIAHRNASTLRTNHQVETRNKVRDLLAAAAADIVTLRNEPGMEPSCIICGRALEGVAVLLEGRAPPNLSVLPDLDMLLHADLLLFDPYPEAIRDGAASMATATTFILAAQDIVGAPPDFTIAFERLLHQARFTQAEQAAACNAADGRADSKAMLRIQDARVQHLRATERHVARLRAQADDLLGADIDGKIDPAVAVRLDALSAVLNSAGAVDGDVSERLDFVAVQNELAGLESDLQCGADMLLVPLQQEIDALEVAGIDIVNLRELAAKRDLTSLRDSLAGSHSLVDASTLSEEPSALLQAFGKIFARKSFEDRPASERSVASTIEDARHRRRGSVLDASTLSDADRDETIKLLQAWQTLISGKSPDTALRDLLQELRLTGVKVEQQAPQSRARSYRITMEGTTDRRDCPVPAFGSAASGKLNVLVADVQGLNGTELHRLAGRAFDNGSVVPVLVIVKGVLPAEHRLLFMKEARRHASQSPCALLDEASILFLATRPGRTRGDMFATALPAGGVQPYSNTSSKSSPEMFFGRAEELAKLWDQGGSCLVYGGRQLGKTALLQQVRVRHDRPPFQVVPYGSLQGQRDLWSFTGDLLRKAGIPCERMTRQGVSGAIRAWLEKDIGRRLLILVDEADTFFAAEVNEGYKSLMVVRDLMQETSRRCKFVFAGLHDVQRLARTPNSPLHHLGMPLGIGPLFGKDLADARSMVAIPMAATGIVFAETSLPNRILSAVGFYPSLLQTFGDTLLTRIGRTIDQRLKTDQLLPIIVTAGDVDDALEDANFKRDISEKFMMTLDLDERYRLITLAILHRMLDRREQGGLAPPLTDVKIQELARNWWPQGFAEDASLSAFQGLLQEMVGLGVLLQFGDRFAIRSSRIAAMLGGKEQIDQQLLELSGRQPPDTLDTGSLRRLDAIGRAPAPLTYRQESILVDWERQSPAVYLVLGSKAIGIDELPGSLSDLQAEDLGVQVKRYDSKRGMETALAETVRACKSGRRNLAILSGPWLGRDMVDMALALAIIRKTPRLRIVLAPQTVDWDAVDNEDGGKLWGAEILTLSPLGRTGLRQWLRAKDVPETAEAMDQLRELTGGFANVFRQMPASIPRDWFDPRTRPGSTPPSLSLSRDDLGLDDERLFAAVKAIVEYDAQTEAEALEVIEAVNSTAVLTHLERLGIIERIQTTEPSVVVNPLVRRLVSDLG